VSSELELIELLAEALRARCTGAEMPQAAAAAGFDLPPADGLSKRDRARNAFADKSRAELGRIARDLGRYWSDFSLEEEGLAVLEEGTAPITEITRRDVAKCFGDDLSGERNVLDLVGSLFPIGTVSEYFVHSESLAEQIAQHMARNRGDWTVEYLFERIGALRCSRDRFSRLLEAALHPLCVRGEFQTDLAQAISSVLSRDGYAIVQQGHESGFPLYAVVSTSRGVRGAPKNLIFGSVGPKPEIGFVDAINNDIVILSNESSCLVYDWPISRNGLLWSELVEWWQHREQLAAKDAAASLGRRLHASLASDGERNLFETYFRLYRKSLGDALPALVPQVYLHYDPAVVKTLRRREGLARQRMDFLLLLPNQQRVVIEVDGSQHFSRDHEPSLELYAQMVSADRELRLAGYEVYRFGANELVGSRSPRVIEGFFDALWALHRQARA
jgi:very-short-patch-repair endonuclease